MIKGMIISISLIKHDYIYIYIFFRKFKKEILKKNSFCGRKITKKEKKAAIF
jgi:hypothetical protein